MITVFLGNLGSGKTLSAVRMIAQDTSGRVWYSNIKTKLKNQKDIKPQHVIEKKEDEKKKRVDYELNLSFWMKQNKPLNVLWDEIHLTADSRSSMTKVNKVISKFIAMGRRIVGKDETGHGELIFIAQEQSSIDKRIRDLTTEIRYHKMYFNKRCRTCDYAVQWDGEKHRLSECPSCGHFGMVEENHSIHVMKFLSWQDYELWQWSGKPTFYSEYMITNISQYFKLYNTHQIEDMWEDYL